MPGVVVVVDIVYLDAVESFDVVRVSRAMKNSMSRRTISGTLSSFSKSVAVDCTLLDRLCWAEEVEAWSCPVSSGTTVDLVGRVDMMRLVGGWGWWWWYWRWRR